MNRFQPETFHSVAGLTVCTINTTTYFMKRLFNLLLLVLYIGIMATPAYSQFEGEITFTLEQFGPVESEITRFKVTSFNDRIYIASEADVNVITGLKSDGLLVRNDLQDFVFNTGENQALKVTKADLDGLMNMIERFSGQSQTSAGGQSNWKNRIIETDNTKQHLGYDIKEIRLLGETVDQYVSIWLTEDIKMMWGIMTNVWNRAGNRFLDPEFPIELVMNSNSFPLLVEVIDNGRLAAKFESVGVETGNFDRSVLELSDQKRLVSITEVMMNMFR